jgi:hypothetical protein
MAILGFENVANYCPFCAAYVWKGMNFQLKLFG